MPSNAPPGPPAAGWFGNLTQFGRDPLGFLTDCARRYGDFVQFRFGPRKVYLLNHPAYAEHVLTTHARQFKKTMGYRTPFMRRLFGEGLLTSEGQYWTRQRRLAQPAFHREHIARYATITREAAERRFQRWKPGERLEIHGEMLSLTTEIVIRTLFSSEVPPEIEALKGASEAVMKQFTTQWKPFRLLLSFLPTPTFARYQRVMRQLDQFIYRLIAERRQRPGPDDDLLALLLGARDEAGAGMTDRQLRDELVTLLVAGLDTSAVTLTWLFYLLSRHSAVEDALAREVETVLGERAPSWDDLRSLKYVEAVVKETMRLYPAAWLIGRQAVEDGVIGEHRIEKDASVLLSQWVSHRDPRNFPNSESFDPARWIRGPEPSKYAYFPFGGGPRVCIGNSFAMMEMTLIVALAAQRFRFSSTPAAEVSPWGSITLQPRGEIFLRPLRKSRVAASLALE